MVTLAVPTMRRYDLLKTMLVASAEAGTCPPDRYYVVDNGGALDAASLGLGDRLTVYSPGKNIGVAAAWNHILQTRTGDEEDDSIVISNDDQSLHPSTIEGLVTAAMHAPESGFFYVKDCAMFGLFLLTRKWFREIGPFDEGFFPAYFEDNDYAYRMKLKGLAPVAVECGGVDHVGSATVKSFNDAERDAHHKRFKLLETYYRGKWGGLPGHETFKAPWNDASRDSAGLR